VNAHVARSFFIVFVCPQEDVEDIRFSPGYGLQSLWNHPVFSIAAFSLLSAGVSPLPPDKQLEKWLECSDSGNDRGNSFQY
jgi:hypothetical protein